MSDVTLWHGDCLDLMSRIPDHSVDMVLADLPYGTTECAWDSIIPLEPLWDHYKRILKPRGAVLLTANQPFTSLLVTSNLEWFRYTWYWRKSHPTGYFNANYRPLLVIEDAVVFSPAGAGAGSKDRGMHYFPQGLVPINRKKRNRPHGRGAHIHNTTNVGANNVINSNSEYVQKYTNYPLNVLEFDRDSPQVHETQKPVALGEYLICTYTNEGEVVLDNTFGSCSFGVAAVNTGRRFIGIERDQKYFAIAQERIAEAQRKKAEEASLPKQACLFDLPEAQERGRDE